MNFKHLHYFWAAAKAGGIVRAGEQLHISPQTLSGQIKLLEDRLGCALFRKAGRGIELTEEGRLALGYADQIFALGAELESKIGKTADGEQALDFHVGIADAVPKAIAYRLLEPALGVSAHVRLICHEGRFQDLLGQLAVHRLDIVIADEPMGRQVSVKAYNHLLGATEMSFFAAPALKRTLTGAFPQCLDGAPMLLQGSSSAMRQRFDFWLAAHKIRPRVIGEFDDAALMKAFGGEGRGIFMTPTVLESETSAQYGVRVVGRTSELIEEFYAVSIERRITHPCIAAITDAAREQLFGS
ncbi:transcriptional activator NhaR [Aquabacterium sp.]|uniref:transcriptional activator NhaR n=1 Tax=Aquabacterium sp. TaxID=1872578 RepID=UPI002B94C1C7|nr:transcriptional activator NhaR [Aquabacterium sp.]HSW03844.1 transcriptional activator NhaR [Aquabacterium sp.]